MRYQEADVLETLRRMQRFLDDNDAALGVVNRSTARKRLDETTAQIAAHAVAQIGGRRTAEGETAKQRALRSALRYDYMRPIAIIANQRLREQPDFKLLQLPPWRVRGQRLIAAARDMANAAEKNVELFVEEGLDPEFVAELRAAADRLEQSVDARGQGRAQRAGATAGLKSETRRARARIRLLDSLVRPKLGTNDALLREWQVAIHIQRRGVPANARSNEVPTTPALTVVTNSALPEAIRTEASGARASISNVLTF